MGAFFRQLLPKLLAHRRGNIIMVGSHLITLFALCSITSFVFSPICLPVNFLSVVYALESKAENNVAKNTSVSSNNFNKTQVSNTVFNATHSNSRENNDIKLQEVSELSSMLDSIISSAVEVVEKPNGNKTNHLKVDENNSADITLASKSPKDESGISEHHVTNNDPFDVGILDDTDKLSPFPDEASTTSSEGSTVVSGASAATSEISAATSEISAASSGVSIAAASEASDAASEVSAAAHTTTATYSGPSNKITREDGKESTNLNGTKSSLNQSRKGSRRIRSVVDGVASYVTSLIVNVIRVKTNLVRSLLNAVNRMQINEAELEMEPLMQGIESLMSTIPASYHKLEEKQDDHESEKVKLHVMEQIDVSSGPMNKRRLKLKRESDTNNFNSTMLYENAGNEKLIKRLNRLLQDLSTKTKKLEGTKAEQLRHNLIQVMKELITSMEYDIKLMKSFEKLSKSVVGRNYNSIVKSINSDMD